MGDFNRLWAPQSFILIKLGSLINKHQFDLYLIETGLTCMINDLPLSYYDFNCVSLLISLIYCVLCTVSYTE